MPTTPNPASRAKKDGYALPEELRQKIIAAVDSVDITVKERNMLHAALNRSLQRDDVPEDILGRWSEAQKVKNGKFDMLKEWAALGCEWGRVSYRETKETDETTYNDKLYGWFTKMDLDMKYHSWEYPSGAAYVQQLIAGAKASQTHPDFPRDKEMKMYKLLNSMVTGMRSSMSNKKSIVTEFDCGDGQAANLALGQIKQTAKQCELSDSGSSSSSSDDEAAGRKRKRKGQGGKPKAQAKAKTEAAPKAEPKKALNKKKGEANPSSIDASTADGKSLLCHNKALELRKLASSFDVKAPRGKMIFDSLTTAAAQLKKLQETFEDLIVNGKGSDNEALSSLEQEFAEAIKAADDEIAFASPRVQ